MSKGQEIKSLQDVWGPVGWVARVSPSRSLVQPPAFRNVDYKRAANRQDVKGPDGQLGERSENPSGRLTPQPRQWLLATD